MSQTIYASFTDVFQAEKAAGALMDYGVRREDLSLVANNPNGLRQEQEVGTFSGEPVGCIRAGNSGARRRICRGSLGSAVRGWLCGHLRSYAQ